MGRLHRFAALAEIGARKALEASRLDRLMTGTTVSECAGANAVEGHLDVVQFAFENSGQTLRHERLATISTAVHFVRRVAALGRKVLQDRQDLMPALQESLLVSF